MNITTNSRKIKLSELQLLQLRPLEKELQTFVRIGETEKVEITIKKIQIIFGKNINHHRLLKNKLWAYEALLDANHISYATSGLIGIRNKANQNTRLHLEASILLSICLLRQKKPEQAKFIIREVIDNLNNIKSEKRRNQFQLRFVERIEEESLLSELIGHSKDKMDIEDIHKKAVLLIQNKHQDEILTFIGDSLPSSSILLLNDVRNYSLLLLPPADRKLLPPPSEASKNSHLGKRTYGVLHRIVWKTFCAEDSEIYQLWSKRIPKVFSQGYFTANLVTALVKWEICIPSLAAGIIALAAKYGATEFCNLTKPKGIMISIDEIEEE